MEANTCFTTFFNVYYSIIYLKMSFEKMTDERRNFLRKFLKFFLFIISLLFLVKYLIPKGSFRRKVFIVEMSMIPANSAYVESEKRIAIINNNNNIKVLSTVCTHLGCNLSFNKNGFFCPCHGSRFDKDGNVIKGPATSPLKRYRYKIKNGKLIVYL